MQTPLNLIVDVGNSFVKTAVFTKGELVVKKISTHERLLTTIDELLINFPEISQGIISSVARVDQGVVRQLQSLLELFILDHTAKLPFKNDYRTPQTLGIDRIALVAAAAVKYPSRHALIIDAGTCITYDFKNKENTYLGGAIAPGIKLRYRSLNDFTANLPLLRQQNPKDIVGDSTDNAIHSGVIYGVQHEIDGIILEYCHTYPDLIVILSGGDAEFLSKRLKNTIFANSDFLLEGLNHLLAFNKSQ